MFQRIIIAIAALPMILIGAIMVVSLDGSAGIIENLSGGTLASDKLADDALSVLGAVIVLFGILLLSTVRDPKQSRNVLAVASLLFGIRAAQRIVYSDQITGDFHADPLRNSMHVLYLFLLCGLLAALALKARPIATLRSARRLMPPFGLVLFAVGLWAAFLDPLSARPASVLFGVSREHVSPQVAYLARPLGAYLLAFGLVCLGASPRRPRIPTRRVEGGPCP